MNNRFDRHTLIPGWSQDRLSSSSVIIIGMGALGNEVSRLLAMAGTDRGSVDLWAYLDDQLAQSMIGVGDNGAMPIDLIIDPSNQFLTLVATDGGNGNGGDWSFIGDPQLVLLPTDRIPEPTTLALLGLGGLALLRRRRRR